MALEKANSADPAQWIVDELHGFAQDVGSFVPDVFEAYTHVPHPRGHEGSLDETTAQRLVEILGAHTATAERCWFAFWGGWGVPVPLTREKKGLARWLDRSTPKIPGTATLLERWDAPKFSIPGRDLLLFSGELGDATEGFYEPTDSSFQSAYFWWPDDRAWFVATEIDFVLTYVGGSRACFETLVADESLKALEVTIEQAPWKENDSP